MTTELNVVDTHPGEWKYISEGAANIVFGYVGHANHRLNGLALRLKKSDHSTPHKALNTQAGSLDVEEAVMFQHRVMSRLIPSEHLPFVETVSVNKKWLESMAELHDADRPPSRRIAGGIDPEGKRGTLATNLIGGQGLAIEIKPKWAFLPSPHHLSPVTRPVKLHTCRFCMFSHLRTTKGELTSPEFCPLDLFSGDKSRVTIAVRSLWDAWVATQGEVNNLRVFVSGKMVKAVDAGSIMTSLAQREAEQSLDEVRNGFIDMVVNSLLQTPVLRILERHQRALDALDIEGILKLHRQAQLESTDQRNLLIISDPTVTEWTEFLDAYFASHNSMDHSNPVPSDLRYYLHAYLLSATLKDCSIILRYNPDRDAGTMLHPSVKVIDLDRKSINRLPRWENLDLEIVATYAKVEQKRRCTDGRVGRMPL